jgi:uncharacterized protein DUF1565
MSLHPERRLVRSIAVRRFVPAIVIAMSMSSVAYAASAPAAPASAGRVAVNGWKVDLGTSRQVNEVKILWRARSTGRYRLRTSLDGRRYQTAGRVHPRRGRAVVVRCVRMARFVRLAGRRTRSPRLVVRSTRISQDPGAGGATSHAPSSAPRSSLAPAPSPAPAAPPATAPGSPSPSPHAAWHGGILPAPLPPSTVALRYVATTGSDANQGTEARPWRSITKALTAAVPGDQVLVRAGTYSGTLGVGPNAGNVGPAVYASPRGTSSAPITLQAYPGERPVIAAMVSLPSAQWFRMSGLIIDGANAPAGAQGVSLGNTSGAAPSHVEISYNEIRNFQPTSTHAQGILHYSGTDTALVGNRIHHIGTQTFYDHAIYMKAGRRVVVANNVIHDITGGYGLHIWGDFDDSWVIHNTVYASTASGFTIGGNDDRGRPDRVVTANNILAGHTGTTDSHQGYAAKEYQPGVGNSTRHNLGWANARSSSFALSTAVAPADNCIADPKFASAAARDLRITPSSAATDAGEDFGLLLDAAGKPRDAQPDLGAYEAH